MPRELFVSLSMYYNKKRARNENNHVKFFKTACSKHKTYIPAENSSTKCKG